MVETQSSVGTDLAEVEQELRGWRHTVSARRARGRRGVRGARHLAVRRGRPHHAQAPVPADGRAVRANGRRRCSPAAATSTWASRRRRRASAVIDRIRGWLPVVLALSANSPFSRRPRHRVCVVPLAALGPLAVGGSDRPVRDRPRRTRTLVRSMVDSGVLLDDGMIYFDARLSHRYPTVEIRVADVCGDLDDTMVVAGVCRALVETAARSAAQGEPPPAAAHGTAAPGHVAGRPRRRRRRPASTRSRSGRSRPRLVVDGCSTTSGRRSRRLRRPRAGRDGFGRLLADGSGATRQRRTYERTGQLVDVVAEAVRLSAGR